MKKLEKTTRENIMVKYYVAKKEGKKVIKAQLTDEYGGVIEGAHASYTLKVIDTETEGKIAARNKALQKLDEQYREDKSKDCEGENDYFSQRWNALSPAEKRHCVEENHKQTNAKNTALTYFENRVLPLLDKFGPNINADQAAAIVDSLYIDMLSKKKYKNCFVHREDARRIEEFFKLLESTLEKGQKKLTKRLGHRVDMDKVRLLLQTVKKAVMDEDRLRSLLESWLQDQKCDVAVKTLCNRVEEDAVLLGLLSNEKTHEQAAEKLILVLRILSGNEKQTKNQVNVHVRDANCILRNLCLKSKPEIPAVTLREYCVEKAPQIELCKELPWSVRVHFTANCVRQAGTNGYACGGIVMMTSGPRVAEVCAIQFGDIVDMGDWGICMINYTADGDIRKDEGKNIYFRRPIFLPKLAMDALHARKETLRSEGRSQEEIATAYVVSRPADIFRPAFLHDYSAAVKAMLQEAGCAENYWTAVHHAMVEEPDLDYFNRPERFAVAYALRRDATTMMCNVAKMDPLLVDAILGHRLPRYANEWSEKIRRDDEWPAIIAQMERIVYDPDHTCNPAFAAIKLSESVLGKGSAVAYQRFLMVAPRACRVKVKVRTVGNSAIRCNLPAASNPNMNAVSMIGTGGPYCSLSQLREKEDYEKIKKLIKNESEKKRKTDDRG